MYKPFFSFQPHFLECWIFLFFFWCSLICSNMYKSLNGKVKRDLVFQNLKLLFCSDGHKIPVVTHKETPCSYEEYSSWNSKQQFCAGLSWTEWVKSLLCNTNEHAFVSPKICNSLFLITVFHCTIYGICRSPI